MFRITSLTPISNQSVLPALHNASHVIRTGVYIVQKDTIRPKQARNQLHRTSSACHVQWSQDAFPVTIHSSVSCALQTATRFYRALKGAATLVLKAAFCAITIKSVRIVPMDIFWSNSQICVWMKREYHFGPCSLPLPLDLPLYVITDLFLVVAFEISCRIIKRKCLSKKELN